MFVLFALLFSVYCSCCCSDVLVVTCCYYCHCFLADAALEDVGAVLAIKSPLPGKRMKLRGFASFRLRWDVAKIVLVELNLMLVGCV